jgi:hypothetical protein
MIMSENRAPSPDPLEAALRAFQGMDVPERPPDEQVLARLGTTPGGGVPPASIPLSSKRRYLVRILVSSAAAAVLLFGGLALYLLKRTPPESVPVAGAVSSAPAGPVALQPRPTTKDSPRKEYREGLEPLGKSVAHAPVIVVATALDAAPAPPKRPGDLAENAIRFRVSRVLKGDLADKEISVRTPTAADELVGKEWIVLLSPEYLAGKHSYAQCLTIKMEATVKAMLSRDSK